jgi:putative DNA primase/helicase
MDFRTVIAELMAMGVIVSQNGKPNKTFHVSSARDKFRLYQINSAKLDDTAGTEDAQSG